MAQPPLVGSIVLFTFGASDYGPSEDPKKVKVSALAGKVRPAIVVADNRGTFNLQVFVDGANDGFSAGESFWATSRVIGDEPAPGACHWPHP